MAGKKKSALGNGLEGLFGIEEGAVEEKKENVSRETFLRLSEIEPNRTQPRRNFDEDALQELADSIAQYGVIQPIVVQKKGKRYEIIAGERRWRAARKAGLLEVPVIVKEFAPEDIFAIALIENIQREDLDSIEVALSFQRLIEECNLTQEAMAERVGKKRATVTNYLRLLKLPAEIQFAIRAKKISMGHAKALLALEDNKAQLKFANLIIEQDLSVRQIEQKIQKLGCL